MAEPAEILAVPMGENAAGAPTVCDYLVKLLHNLWRDEAGFSAKRPFGNSDWQYEVYTALIRAGLIDGQLDDDGYVDRIDERAADVAILAAIDSLGASDG